MIEIFADVLPNTEGYKVLPSEMLGWSKQSCIWWKHASKKSQRSEAHSFPILDSMFRKLVRDSVPYNDAIIYSIHQLFHGDTVKTLVLWNRLFTVVCLWGLYSLSNTSCVAIRRGLNIEQWVWHSTRNTLCFWSLAACRNANNVLQHAKLLQSHSEKISGSQTQRAKSSSRSKSPC